MSFFSIDPPELMGITGDECASCNSTTSPIYALSCHESDDFHCRNCLTRMFYEAADEIVRCPHATCGRPTGFRPLLPLEPNQQLNCGNDQEHIESIRQQPEVMSNLIAFTADEAKLILHHVYSVFEDQILDPVALGGAPAFFAANQENSLEIGLDMNPFVACFLNEAAKAPKMITTPHELDEDLATLLSKLVYDYTQNEYGSKLSHWSVDLTDQDAVLAAALEYNSIREIKENWELMIRKWVELVTWRHLERFA